MVKQRYGSTCQDLSLSIAQLKTQQFHIAPVGPSGTVAGIATSTPAKLGSSRELHSPKSMRSW